MAERPTNQSGVSTSGEAVTDSLTDRVEEGEFLPWLSWMYSLILPIAIWLMLVSVLVQERVGDTLVTFIVQDDASGQAISEAELVIGTLVYRTDTSGKVRIARPESNLPLVVRAEGYVTLEGEWTTTMSSEQVVKLRRESTPTEPEVSRIATGFST